MSHDHSRDYKVGEVKNQIPHSNISEVYATLIDGYWKNLSPKYSYAKIVGREASLDVPDRVHFIWMGKVMPEKYLENMKTFSNNTSYEIYLWTDNQTLNALNETVKKVIKVRHYKTLDLVNKDVLEKEEIGAKSDLLRYEIIYQYGGIYCDTDCVRAKTMPPILKKSFVTMITSGEKFVYNGIFAFAKGSNFLKFVLETLKSSYSNIENYRLLWISCRTGPIFLTSMFIHFYDTRINMFDKDYLVTYSEHSVIYQTFDYSWKNGGKRIKRFKKKL